MQNRKERQAGPRIWLDSQVVPGDTGHEITAETTGWGRAQARSHENRSQRLKSQANSGSNQGVVLEGMCQGLDEVTVLASRLRTVFPVPASPAFRGKGIPESNARYQ